MSWKNDGSARLYVVKRKYAEIYHTGGYRTGSQPQLYKIGYAKSARNQLNKQEEEHKEHYLKHYPKVIEQRELQGPWVIAEIQLCASEVADD